MSLQFCSFHWDGMLSGSLTKFCLEWIMMKLGTFVDFRKAFDVNDHNLLSKKLSVCGASQKVGPGSIISGRAPTVC